MTRGVGANRQGALYGIVIHSVRTKKNFVPEFERTRYNFFPRDAMLAWYSLWSCVRLSVGPLLVLRSACAEDEETVHRCLEILAAQLNFNLS